jgi:hypothetical protein
MKPSGLKQHEEDIIGLPEKERHVFYSHMFGPLGIYGTSTFQGFQSPVSGHARVRVANLVVSDEPSWAILDQSDFMNQVNRITVNPAEQASRLEEQFRAAFGYTQRVSELCQRLENIETALTNVVKKLDRLAAEPHVSLWVPIESLAPEPYQVLRPMTCVVVPADEGFEAALYDLNLYSSGDTQEEAVGALKSLLLDLFDHLSAKSEDLLGPEPLRQKKFLAEHIAKA